ncbi:glutathione S-transferase Mu 4-like [Oscarella lobularis]|uniref:glutathione S-transferase Mu 4-like n=1 Tax=Oscarella lobularis TaxID=121494 RepID=UPI003313F08E
MPVKLGYWAIRGLAQPIRLLLTYCGDEFEEKRYDGANRQTWTDEKFSLGLPLPNLPYLIDGDIKIVQSNAILRYIGRKHNLDGSTEQEKVLVDIFENQVMDMRNAFVRLCYGPSSSFEAGKKTYLEESLPATLKKISDQLGSSKWVAGENITFPDFHLAEMLSQHVIFSPTCLDAYPNLKEYLARFEELPAIKAYKASDKCIHRPINNPSASFH